MEPVPEHLRAEGTLYATGLTAVPDPSTVSAWSKLLGDLRADLLAVLNQEDPVRLLVTVTKPGYADQLSTFLVDASGMPDYEAITQALHPVDDSLAAEYVLLHQAARAAVLARVPSTFLTTALGEIEVPPAQDAQEQFLYEVDALEVPGRLAAHAAAAALLPEVVSLFAAVYPQTYAWLVVEFEAARAEKSKPGQLPPYWLEDVVRTLRQLPPEAQLVPPPPPAPPSKRQGIGTEQFRTPGQAAAATPAK